MLMFQAALRIPQVLLISGDLQEAVVEKLALIITFNTKDKPLNILLLPLHIKLYVITQ